MPDAAFEEQRTLARGYAPDAYATAVLAPKRAQAGLVALAAFLGDVEKIVMTVAEPGIAEIRLQWWRDIVAKAAGVAETSDGFSANGGANGDTGGPLADALSAAIKTHGLPYALFDAVLDARAHDLYADPIPDDAAFEAYLQDTAGAVFGLNARCLGPALPDAALLVPAARAYGIAHVIARLPMFLARGRVPFPGTPAEPRERLEAAIAHWSGIARGALGEARAHWRKSAPADRSACLSLALVEPYLNAARDGSHDAARMLVQVQPVARLWRLGLARATGRF